MKEVAEAAEYEVVTGRFTWKQARNACKKREGDLVSITSKDELNKIHEVVKTWESKRRVGRGRNFLWVGANSQKNPNKWEWSDGHPGKVFPWSRNEPNNRYRERCAALITKDMKLNNVPCNQWRLSFICKKTNEVPSICTKQACERGQRKNPITCECEGKRLPPMDFCSIARCMSGTTCSNTDRKCVPNDISDDEEIDINRQYKVFSRRMDWKSAENECNNWGGNLVSFEDKEEQMKVQKLIPGGNRSPHWTGLACL